MKYLWKRIRILVWEFLSKTVNAHQNSSLYLFMCRNKSQCIFAHSDSFHKRCHIYMGEKWRLSEWKKGKGHNQVVTPVSLFNGSPFMELSGIKLNTGIIAEVTEVNGAPRWGASIAAVLRKCVCPHLFLQAYFSGPNKKSSSWLR